MRRGLRIFGYLLLSLLSADTLIAIIDWLGRWDWLRGTMLGHPHFAAFVKTPFPNLILLILGFSFLWAERRLREPKLIARYTNSRWMPDLHSATMQMLFDSSGATPGWDEHRFDWDWFIEVQMVNDSDTPATVDGIGVSIDFKPKWWSK